MVPSSSAVRLRNSKADKLICKTPERYSTLSLFTKSKNSFRMGVVSKLTSRIEASSTSVSFPSTPKVLKAFCQAKILRKTVSTSKTNTPWTTSSNVISLNWDVFSRNRATSGSVNSKYAKHPVEILYIDAISSFDELLARLLRRAKMVPGLELFV